MCSQEGTHNFDADYRHVIPFDTKFERFRSSVGCFYSFFLKFFKVVVIKMLSGNKYAGLGAYLGVPQSALESVTSLDPKDYLYPSFGSNNFNESIEEQLAGRGAEESMRVFSFEQRSHNLRQNYSGFSPAFGRSSSFSQGKNCVLILFVNLCSTKNFSGCALVYP